MAVEQFFSYPLGLYALLVLVPFILLYLIKPRPKTLSLPTIDFIMKHGGRKQRSSFLRNFIQNLLCCVRGS